MPIFGTLPEDASLEILSRLPIKSLHRFKCVAKSWYACISDPCFIKRHFIRSSNNNQDSLLISHLHPVKNHVLSLFIPSETLENKAAKHFQLSYPASNRYPHCFAEIKGPCNGLFCLIDLNIDGAMFLWNPANQQLKSLPTSHVELPPGASIIDTCVGIGFDNERNDFKVLAYTHTFNPSSSTTAHAKLYSLRTNSWKEVDVGGEFQTTGNLPSSSSYPSINGIFSWFEMDNQSEKVMFSFKLKEEVFVKTRLPDCNGIPSKRVKGCLASLKDSVAFIHGGVISKCYDVWVLGEYGVRESWVKQLTIGPLLGVITTPLGLWKNGELLLEDADGKRVVSYDPITQDMKGVHATPGSVSQVLAYNYKESLVSFKEDDDQNMNREVIHFSFLECQEKDILQMIPSYDN